MKIIHLQCEVRCAFQKSRKKLNKSAIHGDMICDMRDGGQILVDGDLFYESGEFMI